MFTFLIYVMSLRQALASLIYNKAHSKENKVKIMYRQEESEPLNASKPSKEISKTMFMPWTE